MNPARGYQPENRALSPSDCLGAIAKGHRRSSLHLDERNEVTSTQNQIDVVMADPESVAFDDPAGDLEMASGGKLAGEAATMPWVAPLSDGSNDVRSKHVPEPTDPILEALTGLARECARKAQSAWESPISS